MELYELTYAITSQLNSEEADVITKDIESFIQGKEGVILKSEKAFIKMLAYPIRKNISGYFASMEFQAPASVIKVIREKLEKDIKILRHMIILKKIAKESAKKSMRTSLFGVGKTGTKGAPFLTDKPAPVFAEDIDKKIEEILGEQL